MNTAVSLKAALCRNATNNWLPKVESTADIPHGHHIYGTKCRGLLYTGWINCWKENRVGVDLPRKAISSLLPMGALTLRQHEIQTMA